MNKTAKLYILIFILAIIAMLYHERAKPKPINWFPSYTKDHKIPYGTYVLYKSLENLFSKSEVKNIAIPPYVYLKDSKREGSYLFIDKNIEFDKETQYQLMDFVSKGNSVFVSTSKFDIDTLNIQTKVIYADAGEKPFFKLYSTSFKNKEYSFDREFSNVIFSKIDTTKCSIIGQSGFINSLGERTSSGANFIEYKHGNGSFYLHTFPEAFTNYQILNYPNEKYTSGVLSYLGKPTTLLWDSHHKTGKSRISSPMYYILNSKSLKWAYFITLIGILIYILFEGKRKQRSIPIIKPLKNQTLAFTRTIANMYYEKQEHKNIAEHQIQYLLEYIRIKLHIPTYKLDTQFYTDLTARSGKSKESIDTLFKMINLIHTRNKITQAELERLNKMIEKFKEQ